MDANRFDDLTKVLATSTSRRQALKTLMGTAAAALLALNGMDKVFAACKDLGKKCKNKQECCSPNDCCSGTCTALNTTINCGSCGIACPTGQGCCSGTCTALNTTINCGSCGIACPTGQTCQNGQCVTSTCQIPFHCFETPIPCGTGVLPPPNNICLCLASMGGRLVCANSSPCSTHPTCATDQDCANFAPGSFCAFTCCEPVTQGRCQIPCGQPEPVMTALTGSKTSSGRKV